MQYTRLIKSLLVSLVLTCTCSGSFAQSAPVVLPAESGEEVLLFTDRDLYVTAEEIMFSAFYTGPDEMPGNEWSRVLYVELVRWNGTKITDTKVLITEGKAHGSVQLPVDVESGNYYLRAYTKWMRNYSPYNYSYRMLKIVNPKTTVTETGPDENPGTGKPVAATTVDIRDKVLFSGQNEAYGTRERVTLEIAVNDELAGSNFVLGISRKGTNDQPVGSVSFTALAGDANPKVEVQYYPETRGLSVSGKVVEAVRRQPAPDARVNLSTVADPLYFSTTVTDSAGDFLFTFPDIRGDHEFHISVEDAQSGQLELLIDKDFCTRQVTLPYRPFYLTEEERDLVRDLALNAQITARFGISSTITEEPVAQTHPFYGTPDRTIYEKEYIELKNMEEFFYELVYEVNVRRTGGKASLQMSSFGTLVSYPPLVLMDNIRIDNIGELLNVSCRRVERIELVSRGYVIGSRFYSGIISLYSELHDMAGMKLGEDNNFFILSLPEKEEIRFPDYSEEVGPGHGHDPDRRNTLAWYPSVNLTADEPFSTSFYTPDIPGKYTIFLAGENGQDGTLMYATQEILVKE